MKRVAIITGVTGQDGSYLAELLLQKDYTVYGIVRRTSTPNTVNIDHLIYEPDFKIISGDITDTASIYSIVELVRPDEIYNLAAQSNVKVSFDQPLLTTEVTGKAVVNILEAIRKIRKSTRFYQASSSEMFGNVVTDMQDENTPFNPQSPYAVSKVFAHMITGNYRKSYNMFNCCGILFNHESPRRGLDFVTRKITHTLANGNELILGNVNAKRDWGYAPDYVKAMWMMMQDELPDDYVIATGEQHSVLDFVTLAGKILGKEVPVKTSERFERPSEVHSLRGNYAKANKYLGWKPETSFEELVKIMVESDLKKANNGTKLNLQESSSEVNR